MMSGGWRLVCQVLAVVTLAECQVSTLFSNDTTLCPEQKEKKEEAVSMHAPWWIIIIIIFCFIHLIAGVAYANYIRITKQRELLMGRAKKRDRIVAPGSPETPPEQAAKEPVQAPEPIGDAAEKVADASSRGKPVSERGESTADTMKGIPAPPPAEGPDAGKSGRAAPTGKSGMAAPSGKSSTGAGSARKA